MTNKLEDSQWLKNLVSNYASMFNVKGTINKKEKKKLEAIQAIIAKAELKY